MGMRTATATAVSSNQERRWWFGASEKKWPESLLAGLGRGGASAAAGPHSLINSGLTSGRIDLEGPDPHLSMGLVSFFVLMSGVIHETRPTGQPPTSSHCLVGMLTHLDTQDKTLLWLLSPEQRVAPTFALQRTATGNRVDSCVDNNYVDPADSDAEGMVREIEYPHRSRTLQQRVWTRKLLEWDSPQIKETDEGVQADVGQVITHGLQLMKPVVEAESQHTQRSVRFVTLLLQYNQTKEINHWSPFLLKPRSTQTAIIDRILFGMGHQFFRGLEAFLLEGK